MYHAAPRSKRESPVLNGAPRAGSFAGKSLMNVLNTSFVIVLLSITRCPIKLTKACVSAAPDRPRFPSVVLNVVPSLT